MTISEIKKSAKLNLKGNYFRCSSSCLLYFIIIMILAYIINILKIKLDNQMLISPDLTLAPLYYKAGNLYLAREYKKEAIDCFQTILENFPDTALAPKAAQALKNLGVEVVNPNAEEEEEGSTTGQAADMQENPVEVSSTTSDTQI